MTQTVVIEDVTLRGDDLNIVWSAWRSMNRANNLRLIPIMLGFLGSCFVASFLIDPTPTEVFALFAPLLLGWLGFIWVTNAVYVTAYKKAYATAPIGVEACTFTFDGDGMHQTMPRGTTSFRWSAFVEIIEDTKGVRFWMTPATAVFIPARFIDEAQTVALHRLIEEARQRGEVRGVPQ